MLALYLPPATIEKRASLSEDSKYPINRTAPIIAYYCTLLSRTAPIIAYGGPYYLQILPLGNVRHFRRIRKNDTLFLKMCVFVEN